MPPIEPGFMVIHGNKPELLRRELVRRCQTHPLAPLEDETILVQNNAVAQWLKLGMAAMPAASPLGGCGIAAAFSMELPARFLWRTYRAVLSGENIPETSPFDRMPMTWRLMRLLPLVAARNGFEPLAGYLRDDADLRKRYQLAEKVADLFDQYQIYRSDWLAAWSREDDVMITSDGTRVEVPHNQLWQPKLWRELLLDAGDDGRMNRADVHQRFLSAARSRVRRPAGLPRRVSVFGISSMPESYVQALHALSVHVQVLFYVNTHTQSVAPEPSAPYGHPLWSAWGGQGRRYRELLDGCKAPGFGRVDENGSACHNGFENRGVDTLLHRLQDSILKPDDFISSSTIADAPGEGDHSLRFHIVHSPQREVEVLQDQLLAAFDRDHTLTPRDVIVTVPDIQLYAPHIEAVFGQIPRSDPRHIPYALTDRVKRHQDPLLNAVETLLHAPESRFAVSTVLDLLDVPAIRQRFGIREEDLPLLHRWVEQSGIRWGLNPVGRTRLVAMGEYEQNTWLHGLKRMMLGYATGIDPTGREDYSWQGIEPYGEVSGMEAALAGRLATLVSQLEHLVDVLATPATADVWASRLSGMLDDFFTMTGPEDAPMLGLLRSLLDHWLETCKQAGIHEHLPLSVIREHWLSLIDQPRLGQRYMSGGVTFASMVPMRAIPFRMVCLLGMNDGDFPRSRTPVDFDLMALSPRSGDRSQREDDRYLFLEALMSARDALHVSCVGRSIQDNAHLPPSILVSQLRDYLETYQLPAGALENLTVEHRLQPFSPGYFESGANSGAPLFTYAHEWQRQAADFVPPLHEDCLPLPHREAPITFKQLSDFLKDPAKTFFHDRLGIYLDKPDLTSLDQEPFNPDSLEMWQLQNTLIQARLDAMEQHQDEAQAVRRELDRMKRSGMLPLGAAAQLLEKALIEPLDEMFKLYQDALNEWPEACDDREISYSLRVGALEVELDGQLNRWRKSGDQLCRIELNASSLYDKKGPPRHEKLLDSWIRHLAAHSGGQPVTTEIIGKNGKVRLNPLNPENAKSHLDALIKAYIAGLCTPLPLAPKTGFAWLKNKGVPFEGPLDECKQAAVEKALKAYEPQDFQPGCELAESAYLQRLFPNFERLWSEGRFTQACEQLYTPLWNAVESKAKTGRKADGDHSDD